MTTAFSMRSIEEVELQRSRWRRARKSLRLVDEEDECFATGGLGLRVPDLVARLLVVPFDPEANLVSFDAEFWEWWTSERQTPFGRQERVGLNSKPTAYGAAIYDVRHSRDAPNLWDQFLALTRSASIDAGFGTTCRTYQREWKFVLPNQSGWQSLESGNSLHGGC